MFESEGKLCFIAPREGVFCSEAKLEFKLSHCVHAILFGPVSSSTITPSLKWKKCYLHSHGDRRNGSQFWGWKSEGGHLADCQPNHRLIASALVKKEMPTCARRCKLRDAGEKFVRKKRTFWGGKNESSMCEIPVCMWSWQEPSRRAVTTCQLPTLPLMKETPNTFVQTRRGCEDTFHLSGNHSNCCRNTDMSMHIL